MDDSDDDEESVAGRARLLDSDSELEQPETIAARAAIAPYLEDIDRYMRSLEDLRRPRDYMRLTQGAVTPANRRKLVDWLVEVADEFNLPADTLHLAVSYVDRFLSVGQIIVRELQLLGVTALFVAAKYEDDVNVHKAENYSDITDNTYTSQQVVDMEANMLKLLNFEMGSPTARTFLRRYITACRPRDPAKAKKLEFLCSYLAELSLLDYDCTMFKPSVVAAACLFVARFTISPNTRPWNLTLHRNTGYNVSDLECCIFSIQDLQLNGRFGRWPALEEKAIKDKYRHCKLERVSAMLPLNEIPEYFLKDIKQ